MTLDLRSVLFCTILANVNSGCMSRPACPPSGQSSAPSDGQPAIQPVSASDVATVPYPFAPAKEAPVPLPEGQGREVRLERYIVVDQFGYRPELEKVAVLADPKVGWNANDRYEPGQELEVRKWSDGAVVFSGRPVPWNGGEIDASAGDRGAWFDFSPVREPGVYYVYDPGSQGRSHPFEIRSDVYARVLRTAARMFYFNRANVRKEPPYSCVGERCWSLGADNVGAGQDREARSVTDRQNAKTARDLSGGWWDAGDTNKYVTFSNDAVHQLLTAYQENPRAFRDDFGIPESGNGIPDLIDELVVELEWLKKMQPADLRGGALLKVGYAEYGDPVPDESRLPRFYYPNPCSSATIVLASQFAHAAIVLAGFPRFQAMGNELGKRAREAWAHYHANPKSDACDDGTIKSGDADRSLGDQEQIAVVAAVYLYALTGEARFGEHVKKNYGITRPFQDDMWSVYDQSQGDALLYYARLSKADPEVSNAILSRKAQLTSAELYGFRPELDLYRAYMRRDSYHWGSNNARASYGNTNYDLIQYGVVPPSEQARFRTRAAELLHSFHGVNPMQLVYLTNMYADGAESSADEAYHAWFRDKHPKWDNARTSELGPAPGYVTGGPNKNYCEGQDPKDHACARSPVREQPPEKAYVDSNTSYEPSDPYDKTWELTEPAIYYQASYIRLLSKFVD